MRMLWLKREMCWWLPSWRREEKIEKKKSFQQHKRKNKRLHSDQGVIPYNTTVVLFLRTFLVRFFLTSIRDVFYRWSCSSSSRVTQETRENTRSGATRVNESSMHWDNFCSQDYYFSFRPNSVSTLSFSLVVSQVTSWWHRGRRRTDLFSLLELMMTMLMMQPQVHLLNGFPFPFSRSLSVLFLLVLVGRVTQMNADIGWMSPLTILYHL